MMSDRQLNDLINGLCAAAGVVAGGLLGAALIVAVAIL